MSKSKVTRVPVRLSDHRSGGLRAHRWDAAQTTDHNTRHWANASSASANAAANSFARHLLRNRARYEVANNSYARGMALTLANDVIGRGPRLQLLPVGRVNPDRLNGVEKSFMAWAKEIRLAEKLRTMRMARCSDGEAFAVLRTNPRLRHPVKLDVELVEADQVTDEGFISPGMIAEEGIRYDQFGNAISYTVVEHDDDTLLARDARDVPADQMIHWYRADRPGQRRGICEIAPALELFAQLRRYTSAVLGAAETAADIAMVIYSDLASPDGPAQVDAMDAVDLEARMATTLPEGWKLGGFKAEQPTTTYADFKKQVLEEIARCLNMPFNVAAGNSAGYNYASGRLDHQMYYKSIDVERHDCEAAVLANLLRAWFEEAQLIDGLLPQTMRRINSEIPPAHRWFWDGREHVDPAKVANANKTNLATGQCTLPELYAARGLDHEVEIESGAFALGLTPEQYRAALVQSIFGVSEVELIDADDVEDDDEN